MSRWLEISILLLPIAACAQSQSLQGLPDAGPVTDTGAAVDAGPAADSHSTNNTVDSGTTSAEDSGLADAPAPDSASTDSSPPDSGAAGATHIVLFGGLDADGNGLLDDTWTWDGASWTQQQVGGPTARAFPAGASHKGTGVMFGGETCLNPLQDCDVGDTWVWNGAAWTLGSTSGPAAYHGAVASTLGNDLVLFGVPGPDTLPQTWVWTGATWIQQNLSESGPTVSIDWTAATLGTNFLLIVQGGIWSWNGMTWSSTTNSGGPNEEGNAGAATLDQNVVLFGGDGQDFGSLNETWTFDGTNWTLHNLSGAVPSPRSNPGMATLNGTVVLFGGCVFGTDVGGDAGTVGTVCTNDTWTWDGTSWTLHQVSGPSPRGAFFMAAY